MLDNIKNATSLGKIASNSESSGVAIGDSAFDFGTGLLDSNPISKVVDIPLRHIEEGFSQIEKIKIIESVKQKFHVYVSQKLANSVSSFTTPSVRNSDRTNLLEDKTGQNWLAASQQIYKNHQQGMQYKMQRKLQDTARIFKKKPLNAAKIPLSLVPLGEAANLGIKAGGYVLDKLTQKRKARKKANYLSAGNSNMLMQKLGAQEYSRKQAKWKAKDIAELGPTIQRNLYKLKQSVEVLNSRTTFLNQCVQQHATLSNEATLRALTSTREQTAMSLYEVKHYVEKISEMCKTMEATAFTINAYMLGLSQVTEDCSDSIIKSFK